MNMTGNAPHSADIKSNLNRKGVEDAEKTFVFLHQAQGRPRLIKRRYIVPDRKPPARLFRE